MSTTRTARATLPVVNRLKSLADEFDQASAYYERHTGTHNELLLYEARRAAAQLRLVARLVTQGSYSQTQGVIWLEAAWRIINAIGRSNIK